VVRGCATRRFPTTREWGEKGCLVSTSGEALCAHTMQRDCWGRGGYTLQPTNTVLHLPCSVNVRPVTIAQSSSHLDAWAHPASLINVGPATWTLCVQPDWRFSLTVLVVAFSSSGFVFLALRPLHIDRSSRGTHGADRWGGYRRRGGVRRAPRAGRRLGEKGEAREREEKGKREERERERRRSRED
jgi:hypothetical protein